MINLLLIAALSSVGASAAPPSFSCAAALGDSGRWARSFALLAVLGVVGPSSAADESVDLMLVLATDVSASVEPSDYQVQRRGILAALEDPEVARAIQTCAAGGVALSYTEWAGYASYRSVVPFRRVRSHEDLAAFAVELRGQKRSQLHRGYTDIATAIDASRLAINGSRYKSSRRVIDVSGDGETNDGPPEISTYPEYRAVLDDSRGRAVADGIQINGLAMDGRQSPPDGFDSLHEFYAAYVAGGPGSFVVWINTYEDMHQRLKQKLAREICGGANF